MCTMRRTLITAALIAFFPVNAGASDFTLYAHAYLDSTRSPAARVTAEIPYKSLVFFKKEGWYDSRFKVYLKIDPVGGDGQARTTVLKGHAVARSYSETTKRELRAKTSRAFLLEPGRYRVSATLRVGRTSIAMDRMLELVVPDFLATGIGFGSLSVLLLPPGETTVFARWSEFRERPATAASHPQDVSLTMFDRRPAVRFELYVDGSSDEPLPCSVFYEVLSPRGQQMLYGRHRVGLKGEDDAFVLSFNVDDWDPGSYTIKLRAKTKNPERDASASVVLNVDVTRAMLGRDFDDTLDILSLIASRDELKGLRDSGEADRAEEWSKFWSTRNPDATASQNEALQEHLRRVRFVMKEFSQLGPGWRSDRGRVYLRHGRPDRIEHASDSRYQGDYEIWRYGGMGRAFVFYDMFGLGDYRLVQGDMF